MSRCASESRYPEPFANRCLSWLNVLKVLRREPSELGVVFVALQPFGSSVQAQSRLLALAGSDPVGSAVLLRLLDVCCVRGGKDRAYSGPGSYRRAGPTDTGSAQSRQR